jgi:nucleotide-binding universal stress UspA family protein
MGQKILIAFDGSENSLRAVKYIADHFFAPGNKITLLSIIQESAALCEMDSAELLPFFASKKSTFCEMEDKKREQLTNAQQEGKEVLLNAGFKDEDITVKLEINKKGIAREIVAEAQSGYDVIVLGRRGLSDVKEYFLGSISQKVIHTAKDLAVLIVN